MQPALTTSSWVLLAIAVVAGSAIIYAFYHVSEPKLPLKIKLPSQLSSEAMQGKSIFEGNCKKCHGGNAAGSDRGPPLVHKIYATDHHPDISFQRAVEFGVKSHHWRFGDMAAVPDLTKQQVALVIRYVRELQQAKSIR